MLTNAQFDRTRRLALRLAGIELFERHRELLGRRSRRLGVQDGAGLESLLTAAEEGDLTACRHMVGLVTTRFTGFFRHPGHFEITAGHALRTVHRRGQARLWSAGAATGEEPYSLAMALSGVFPREEPPVTILATDINEEALAVARRGEYGEAALSALTPEQRARFFGEATARKQWHLVPEILRLVEFRVLNLIDPVWLIEGPFDVILCRNVLMYLEAGHRYSVLDRLASVLAPDGRLLLDPTEHLGPAAHLFGPGSNGVYASRLELRAGAHRSLEPASRKEDLIL